MPELLTVGPMAQLCGVQENHLRKLCRRGKVPYGKVGRYFAFEQKDAAKIRAAAVKAGYLTEPATAPTCQE